MTPRFPYTNGGGRKPEGSGRFGDWTPKGKPPKKYSVQNDKWDREDLEKMLESIPPFSTARRRLSEFTETGAEAMADTFWSFLKTEPETEDPKELSPKFRINHRVNEELRNLDEYQQLKRYSENDDVQAALSCIATEPDLQTLFDRLGKQREKAQELEDAQKALEQAQQEQDEQDDILCGMLGIPGQGQLSDEDIDQLVKQAAAPHDGESEEEAEARGQATEEAADELAKARQELADAQAEHDRLEEEFEESLDRGASSMRGALREGMGKAVEEARQTQEQADAWGMSRGELQRLPAQERMDLAKRLNNPRFRRIADLFGPMRNVMFTEQTRKVEYAKEEIYDVGLGSDLGRILPQELLQLDENEDEFLRRFSEGKLLQYEMQGTERLARGGIIFCEDGSGSMRGNRELWSKAVMLCLLHLARQQKRPMHVVHFGSPGEYKVISFVNPEDFTLERILDTAELFFGGGTHFQTPMKVSLEILQKEHLATGAVKADVVFMTDDECAVPHQFMDEYLSEAERMQFTTFGISVSGNPISKYGALSMMSEGKVLSIKDFYSGEEIRDIFRAL